MDKSTIINEYKNYKKYRKIPKYIDLDIQTLRTSVHKVLLIIPFRDTTKNKERTRQLNHFINHYMNNQPKNNILNLNASILIIEQSNDGKPFNRGALLNIGFELGKLSNPDIYIFHDVDLLSSPKIYPLYYTYPEHPIHIGALWKSKYNFYTFFGGINSFNKEDFETINGFPNTFYGWGGEDDAIFNRLAINDIPIIKPRIFDSKSSKEPEGFDRELIIDLHPEQVKIKNLKDELNKRCKILKDLENWKYDGLNSLKYNILSSKNFKNKNVIKIKVQI